MFGFFKRNNETEGEQARNDEAETNETEGDHTIELCESCHDELALIVEAVQERVATWNSDGQPVTAHVIVANLLRLYGLDPEFIDVVAAGHAGSLHAPRELWDRATALFGSADERAREARDRFAGTVPQDVWVLEPSETVH